MIHEAVKIKAEEKFFCQKFWEMDYFLEDGGWQDMGRQSLEQAISIGEKLLSSPDFEIRKNVEETISRYKEILADITLHPRAGE